MAWLPIEGVLLSPEGLSTMHVQASGRLCAVRNFPYNFKDEETGAQVEGVSRKAWLTSSLAEPPTVVSVQKDAPPSVCADFDRLLEAEHLQEVTLLVSLAGSTVRFVGVQSL